LGNCPGELVDSHLGEKVLFKGHFSLLPVVENEVYKLQFAEICPIDQRLMINN
jgi:hypothetical protein